MTFLSLTHARAVRDKLAKEAIEDGAGESAIEAACRADGNYRATLDACAADIFEGFPPPVLQSLVDLGDAIEYIAKEERRLAKP